MEHTISCLITHAQVVDDMGKEHEVLLRSFLHEQETMYLLDRLASLLQAVNAQAGDMLMLTREETGPVVWSCCHISCKVLLLCSVVLLSCTCCEQP